VSAPEPQKLSDLKVDTANLYREEMFTDLRVATLRRLTPIKPDGSVDPARQPLFTGETSLLTPGGVLPVQCPIQAKTLQEALEKFPQAAQEAVENMVAEIHELQRQEASRIVVPRGVPPGALGDSGGGKIQLG
jgi:hypothetical protein